jgi:hypothetical protein
MIETDDKEETMPTNKECEGEKMIDTNEEKQSKPHATPRSKVSSNDVNMTPPKINYVGYIRSRVQQCP